MARTNRNQARKTESRIPSPKRKATVVHDGSAFELATDLRRFGYRVSEGPLFSPVEPRAESGSLAILATRSGATENERLREWARQLCWRGVAVLAVGAAIGPVAELFGTVREESADQRVNGRLADIRSASEGLFAGLPPQFRLALPAGDRFESAELSAEFNATAWSRDGELIGASHVFRPVHLLHPAALDCGETRPIVLENLLRLMRDKGGRAF